MTQTSVRSFGDHSGLLWQVQEEVCHWQEDIEKYEKKFDTYASTSKRWRDQSGGWPWSPCGLLQADPLWNLHPNGYPLFNIWEDAIRLRISRDSWLSSIMHLLKGDLARSAMAPKGEKQRRKAPRDSAQNGLLLKWEDIDLLCHNWKEFKCWHSGHCHVDLEKGRQNECLTFVNNP